MELDQEKQNQEQDYCMNNSGYRCLATVVDVRHGTGDSSGGRNTSEQRSYDIGCSLCNQFCIGVVAVAYHTVGYRGRQQRFDSSQYGNGDSYRKQFPDSFPIQRRHNGIGQLRFNGEAVADCLDAVDSSESFHQVNSYRHYDDGNQRAGNFL